jgi:lysophospholipase L1-like esterase
VAGIVVALAAAAGAFVLLRAADDSPLQLVSMGDSYSAGAGLGEVTEGNCDRDPGAYGPSVVDVLAEVDSDLEIADVDHVACSGAVSANIFSPQRIRARGNDVIVDPQLDAVGADTDVVTITVGGNDADFSAKVVTCRYRSPAGDDHDYIDTENGICSRAPYLTGFDPATLFSGDASNNFHPTGDGYDFAAEQLADAMNDRLGG